MNAVRDNQVSDSVDHLFRRHAGQMVSVLCRIFGLEKLDLIEDAVQDALVAALKKWPFSGTPANPTAWLAEVAKNRVLDQLRHGKKSDSIEAQEPLSDMNPNDGLFFASEIAEDQLRMIFACCHPSIPPDSQVALTLKVIGGFGVAEIARAYLSNDEAIAKMLTRAKKKLRVEQVKLEIPAPAELPQRLDSVLKVLYLMFNEGYAASGGDDLVRKDLCFEAIRLCEFLSSHPVTRSPQVNALAALFLFQGARLAARIDHSGDLLLLADQDRSLWDRRMLAEGLEHFRLSANGTSITDYHLEAEIAAHHALAADYESTDWPRILECYDELKLRRLSAVAELNRVVAVEKVFGPETGIEELRKLEGIYHLTTFNLFHITKAHLLAETYKFDEALASYERALQLTSNAPVRKFLLRKIEMLRSTRHAKTHFSPV